MFSLLNSCTRTNDKMSFFIYFSRQNFASAKLLIQREYFAQTTSVSVLGSFKWEKLLLCAILKMDFQPVLNSDQVWMNIPEINGHIDSRIDVTSWVCSFVLWFVSRPENLCFDWYLNNLECRYRQKKFFANKLVKQTLKYLYYNQLLIRILPFITLKCHEHSSCSYL